MNILSYLSWETQICGYALGWERNICTTAASWRRGTLDTGLYVLLQTGRSCDQECSREFWVVLTTWGGHYVPQLLFPFFFSRSLTLTLKKHIWTNMSGCGVPKHKSCDDIINRSYKPWDWNLRCCLVSDSQLSTRHCAWTQLFFGEKKHYHPRARGRQTKLASRLTETDTSLCSWWRPKIEQKGEWLLDVQLSDGQKHISKWEIILLCMCWMSEYVNVVCLQHVSIAP